MSFKDEAVYLKVENIRSDVKQIKFYANEEYDLFAKLSSHFKSIKNHYTSPNSGSFNGIGDHLLKERDGIKRKRVKYNDVLKRNIDIYLQGKATSIGIFSKSGDRDE